MSLKDRIDQDMKDAMRAKDSARLESIRLLRAAIQRREVDERITLADDEVVSVLQRQIKQGRDAIAQFTAGGREDLASKERYHLEVLQAYMPQPMDAVEIDQSIQRALAQTGASGIRDMGKVMALLKAELQGRADMGVVSAKVKGCLAD